MSNIDEVMIDGKKLNRVQYQGKTVITTKEIAEHHGLDVKVVNQKFRRNKKHFTIGDDYFEVAAEEVRRSQIVTTSKFDSSSYVLFITESGYLKFVKTINDDKAWHIYGILIGCYFQSKRLNTVEAQFLEKSKEHRKGITSEWAQHEARDYKKLTMTEYESIGFNSEVRKRTMDDKQLGLLSVFEMLETKKLQNNPDIKGDNKLVESMNKTGSAIIDIIKPMNQISAL